VCRQAKIQPHKVATLYPLFVSPTPWHILGFDYLTHLHVSNGFDNVLIVVDHLTRMAHFLPCTNSAATKETPILFLHGVYRIPGLPLVLFSDRDPRFAYGRRFGDALERGSTCLPGDTHRQTD
jgi:hypothetical protein